jgi:methionyl-tRNA formyltransferase
MKLIFLGTPQFAVPSLERLLSQPGMDVIGVVTQPDKRRGRGNELVPSPIKAIALQHQVPVWQPRWIKKDSDTLDLLRAAEADAFVVVAYGQLLSQDILDLPRLGCINAHGSLLPKYRGAAPIQWSLYHGEAETGVTTMLMDAGMDTGAMLLKATLPIGLLDNALDVAKSLAAQSADLLVETLLGLQNHSLSPLPQNPEQATYAPLIKKADYALDWAKGAIALHHQVRGFYPNCTATFRDQPLKVLATVPLGRVESAQLPASLQAQQSDWAIYLDTNAAPGTVVGLLKAQGPLIQTGDGLLLLHEIQLAGKRAQSGWDFVNGMRLTVADVIGSGV